MLLSRLLSRLQTFRWQTWSACLCPFIPSLSSRPRHTGATRKSSPLRSPRQAAARFATCSMPSILRPAGTWRLVKVLSWTALQSGVPSMLTAQLRTLRQCQRLLKKCSACRFRPCLVAHLQPRGLPCCQGRRSFRPVPFAWLSLDYLAFVSFPITITPTSPFPACSSDDNEYCKA